jgi:hypothetical protein
MAMRLNREAHLEAAGCGSRKCAHRSLTSRAGPHEPAPAAIRHFKPMMALIFAVAGSITASNGCPRPVSGIEFA